MEKNINSNFLTNKIRIRPNFKTPFAEWQADLNMVIAAFPGFVSLEILSPSQSSQFEWIIVQRFSNNERVLAWRESVEYKNLINKLRTLLAGEGADAIKEIEVDVRDLQSGVTEVFVTEVSPDRDKDFRKWISKIHQVEANFPGFRGVYVQSPAQEQGKNWITLLQFDTPENLDHWLSSPERRQVLNESDSLISSLESHRVISAYSGWFSTIAKGGQLPPVWKQTMLILLVLFPIVMFEMKYLNPLTKNLGSSLAVFISNALSVTLLAWPMIPLAIKCLSWWLLPIDDNKFSKTIMGTLFVIFLYAIEVLIFWNFL